jgi:hypothetical protein
MPVHWHITYSGQINGHTFDYEIRYTIGLTGEDIPTDMPLSPPPVPLPPVSLASVLVAMLRKSNQPLSVGMLCAALRCRQVRHNRREVRRHLLAMVNAGIITRHGYRYALRR